MAQAANLFRSILWVDIYWATNTPMRLQNQPRDFPRDASSELSWSFATSCFESKTDLAHHKDELSILLFFFGTLFGGVFLGNKLGRQLSC